ncbi:MAG: sigma-70 family RNA polymerase sigma factor [Clostridia bacterium]|nr:sigma-70 family RNA polymerase sigma factor [Clostridia bacterium]
MDDKRIVELFLERNEQAILESEKKYKRLITYIAKNILRSDSDSEETVNDTYLRAWDSIPPNKPVNLGAYLGKIARNLSLDKLNKQKAQKRGGDEVTLAFEELEGVIGEEKGEGLIDEIALKNAINSFLSELKSDKRIIFVQRYWYFCSIEEIAKNNGLKENNVKIILLRLRDKLKRYLEKEGF